MTSQAQKRANSQTVTPARKKSKSFDVIEKIRELDLESLLLADRTGGKELLLCFREAQEEFKSGNSEDPPTLSDRQRLKLSHILAEYLLTLDDCLSYHNHPLVTKKIVSLFPWETEVRTDYFCNGRMSTTSLLKLRTKQQTHAKGKLVSAIRNINSKRNLLGQVNEPSTSGGDNSRQLSNQTTCFRAIVAIADTSERQGARAWLVHGRTPWPKVIENWILTAPHRFRTHFITSTSGFVNEYINSLPILSHKSGHQLLLEDFKLLYPGASSRLTLALAKKEIKDQEAIAILKLAENKSLLSTLYSENSISKRNFWFSDGVASVILHILANIKSNHSIQQEGKRVKVSAGKCRNSYLLTVKTANDITRALEERRSELIDENGGGQPLIVLVCSSPDNVRSAHVSVASLRYDLDSVLEALDVCFKLYQSLHCKYPPESKHIWTVLQRGIYKINLKGDTNILHSWIKLYDLSA
ncbi:hypothetical protein FOCC_FOCC014598 [Frankliniella occidentalis]|nr:hypothetical protein FOCC_FOCC014598 [Frankliniella occidentalis]